MSILSYKYFVVEDEPLIRKNLIKKMESLKLPFCLAGQASNGMDARLMIDKLCPDLVITDIRMPEYDGLWLAEYLSRTNPNIKVVILSGYDDFTYAQSALRFHVRDYLLKPVTAEALSESMHKILLSMQSESEALDAFCTDLRRMDQKTICGLLEQYLLENYQTEISFGELGERFGFTPEYLGKIFKKHTGETLSRYLTRLRMNEAKRLLAGNPDMPIQKIGELVGYKDGFYFSRAFKGYTGTQPSEFRNQAREG